MKITSSILILICLITTSCLEEFEPDSRSFVKVFGENLDSYPYGMLLEEDGILIYGSVSKSVQASSFQSSEDIPLLIMTDLNGNELWSKQFPINELKNLFRRDAGDFVKDSLFTIAHSNFFDMVQLNNGNYFAIIRVCIDGIFFNCDPGKPREPAYAILDEEFNIVKLRFFNDREKEEPFNHPLFRHSELNSIYKIPGSNDIIVLSRMSFVIPNDLSNQTHAAHRITQEGEFKWSKIYDESLPNRSWANHLTFSENGDLIIVGNEFLNGSECSQPFIELIDVERGDLLERTVFEQPNSWYTPISIQPTTNGYIIQEITPANEDCILVDFENPNPESVLTGSLRFVDRNFSTTNKSKITDSDLIGWNPKMIKLSDSGHILGFSVRPGNDGRLGSILLKIDEFGDVKWSFKYDDLTIGYGKGILEMNDGSILFYGYRQFNSTGYKWVLTKLTSDGKLH